VIDIRSTRLKKNNNKKRKFILLSKILAIFYVLVITLTYLNSNTGAYFSDSADAHISINSGIWEDSTEKGDISSLAFLNKDMDQIVNSCIPVDISVMIKNNGSDMIGTSEYEVYYTNSGNPKNGSKMAQGTINIIKASQTTSLTYLASKSGSYKFRAFRPGHKNDYTSRKDLWSETLTIVCKEKSIDSDTTKVENNSKQNQGSDKPAETSTQTADPNNTSNVSEGNNNKQNHGSDSNKIDAIQTSTPETSP
jgi:YqxM protein